jgi:hypothetical protein
VPAFLYTAAADLLVACTDHQLLHLCDVYLSLAAVVWHHCHEQVHSASLLLDAAACIMRHAGEALKMQIGQLTQELKALKPGNPERAPTLQLLAVLEEKENILLRAQQGEQQQA